MFYSISKIAKILNIPVPDNPAQIDRFLTDSRSLDLAETTLFFALRSQRNDGHRYIRGLYEKGVRNFVVQDDFSLPNLPGANFLVVHSPLEALQSIARHHRYECREVATVAITGSKGKTIVKEWLNAMLSDSMQIDRSPRSYNSQIGVPLSVCSIRRDSALAIIETGISKGGEMQQLADIVHPTYGIFTNIGDEHSEGFASIEDKCRQKAIMFLQPGLKGVVYCADCRLIDDCLRLHLPEDKLIGWSRVDSSARLFILEIKVEGACSRISYCSGVLSGDFLLPFTADADIENAIHCLAVLIFVFRLTADEIAEKMRRLPRIDTRIDVFEGVNNCLVVSDNYTCDYRSLEIALDFCSRRATGRKRTVILSDLEGNIDDYRATIDLLVRTSIDRLIAIGDCWLGFREEMAILPAKFFATTSQFLDSMGDGNFIGEEILVKGSPRFRFSLITEMLEERRHETILEVNLDNLVHNFNFFRSRLLPDTGVVCMVKASGYGAGSYEIAKTLQDRGAAYLAVAVLDEGADLRKAGITMPVMVLNPVVMNYRTLFDYRLEPEIFSLEMCRDIIEEGRKYGVKNYPVHIKIDTGMHRLGFREEQLAELADLLQSQDVITPHSVFSHLCVADCVSQEMDSYTHSQFDYFDVCRSFLVKRLGGGLKCHILNTAGILRFPEKQFDMVRLGIGLYGIGILANGSEDELRPVSALYSVVISIKEWEPGTTIGYGRKGVLMRKSRIATIPVGYADGFNRHFGNGNCSMWVNGTLCPTVGNICMDVCMLDITDADCKVGDRVEIFGPHVPVEWLSDTLGTIPYEILTSVSKRVKRIYFRE